jgi:DeoR family glycerol-3-phosphate regulon repressor
MRFDTRHDEIVALIRRRGYMSIERLAERFKVTPQTIRRDINILCGRKLLVRQHGGASLPSSVAHIAYVARHGEQAREKERIGKVVAETIPDRSSLFLALGTTVEAVAEALKVRKGLKLVTNNPEVARLLWRTSEFEIIVTGGNVQRRNGGLAGSRAVAAVCEFRCDYAVIGIGAIEPDGGLYDYSDEEVAVVRTMINHAHQVFLVADHTKFVKRANQIVASIKDVSVLFTDSPPPTWLSDIAAKHEVEIVVAQ